MKHALIAAALVALSALLGAWCGQSRVEPEPESTQPETVTAWGAELIAPALAWDEREV